MIAKIKIWINAATSHPGFLRYFKNTSWMFAEQLLRMISGLLVGVWVARYLGPEQFGIFSYVLAFVAIFSAVAKLGLDSIVVRELIKSPERKEVNLGTAFWLKCLGAAVSIALILIFSLLANNDQTTTLYILIIASGITFKSFDVIDYYFQSKVLAKYVSICKLVQLILSSLLKIYFVLSGADLFWFVAVSFLDHVMLAITLYLAYKHHKGMSFFTKFDRALSYKLLADSWPLMFSSLVIMIYLRIDQLMIKEMLGVDKVGIYSAALKLSEVWYAVPILICTSLLPALVRAKESSRDLYIKRLQKLYTLMAWSAILIALLVTFLGDWIIVLLYGELYLEAGSVLQVLIWGGVFVFLGVAFGHFLVIEKWTKKVLYRNFIGMVINVILNFILIKEYGLIGAAISSVFALIVTNYIYDIFDNDLHHQFKIRTMAIFCPIKTITES